MRARLRVNGADIEVDLDRPVDLAVPIAFDGAAPEHFGAPQPRSTPYVAGSFTGDVATGASCNCRAISLIPHCNGTHTECVAHVTLEALDAWRIVPPGLVAALVASVAPTREGEDRVVTRAAVVAAWRAAQWRPVATVAPQALVLRTLRDQGTTMPPYVAAEAIDWIVAQGIAHLVVDLPSIDRTHDAGRLAGHRAFFGLHPGSRALADATRPHATITELARVPDSLPDGPCLLAWQVPAIAGDAVPSRPLVYRYAP